MESGIVIAGIYTFLVLWVLITLLSVMQSNGDKKGSRFMCTVCVLLVSVWGASYMLLLPTLLGTVASLSLCAGYLAFYRKRFWWFARTKKVTSASYNRMTKA